MPQAFAKMVEETDETALRALGVRTLLVNVGLKCDLRCAHCHLRCSPERTERMTREMMGSVVEFAARLRPTLVDVTGGAPELHPHILEFLESLVGEGLSVRMRTNLTALSQTARESVPQLSAMGVGLLASVPRPDMDGPGRDGSVWEACVSALGALCELGYGTPGGPVLDIACTADVASTAREVAGVETALRKRLGAHGITFDEFVLITCVPVGRFADGLGHEGVAEYLRELSDAFEPDTLPLLGCRHGVEIAWDGTLWDCDFNLGAGLAPPAGFRTLAEIDPESLRERPIAFGAHCYACTARSGSS